VFCLGPLACDRGGGSDDPDTASGKVNRKVKCESQYKYDGRKIEGSASYGKFGAQGETSVERVREVDQAVERYTAKYLSLCNDYRNGAISQSQYGQESARLREGMHKLETLMLKLDNAQTAEQFNETLSEMRSTATVSGQNADLSLEVAVWAKVPDAAEFQVSPQGATLGSGSSLYLEVSSTAHAYLYLYQVNAAGKMTVLFPNEQIPIVNPIPAGQGVRVPHGDFTFDVDENDLGLENLHIVASAQPLASLADEAKRDESGGRVADNDLDCGTRALTLSAPPTCTKTRGLVLNAGEGRAAPRKSVSVQADDADDAVHVVYSFHHVGDHKKFGTKTRGVEMLTGEAANRKLPEDFADCPSGAELKQMPLDGGALEKWCVEANESGAVLDHGPYRKWHANGKLWVKGDHDWGERTGTWETFADDGSSLAKATY